MTQNISIGLVEKIQSIDKLGGPVLVRAWSDMVQLKVLVRAWSEMRQLKTFVSNKSCAS